MNNDIPSKTIEFDINYTPTKKDKLKNILIKSVIATGVIITGLGLNSIFKSSDSLPESNVSDKMTFQEMYSIPSPVRQDYADVALNDSFILRDNLSVNNYVFDRTVALFDTLSFEESVKLGRVFTFFRDASNLTDSTHIDFETGVKNEWNKKVLKDLKNDDICTYSKFAKRIAKSYSSENSTRMDLDGYTEHLSNALVQFNQAFDIDSIHGDLSYEKERLFDNFYDAFTPNVILSYMANELFPAANQKFNFMTFGKYLEVAGLEALYFGTPSQNDTLLSFGPAQLTPRVVTEGGLSTLNRYLTEDYHLPNSMEELNTIEKYDRAMIANLVVNTRILAYHLDKTENTLENFNDLFESLPDQKQHLLVSGILSSMNYRPADVSIGVANYTDEAFAGRNPEDDIVNKLYVNRAQDYYDSSVKYYLALTHN